MSSAPSRGPVILVHGVWMVGVELLLLSRGLRRAGFGPVKMFHYPSVRRGLGENARRLADFRHRVESRHGPAHVVGHSLGGVIVWRLFHDHGGGAEPGGRVVTLGAPFQGSTLARYFAKRGPLGRFVVGECWRPAADHSPAPGRRWPGPAPLGIIAGCAPKGVGALLGVFPGPNDGMVALRETELDGAADRRVLPVNHVALTFNHEAVSQTAHFLSHGQFVGPGSSFAASAAPGSGS